MIHTEEPYIVTYAGRRIYVRDPNLNTELHLRDFAHALARIARFNGHSRHRYSVAAHCLMVADLVTPEHRASALLHDAVEAILGDVTSPVKALLPEYAALQTRWTEAMFRRWGVALPGPEVKRADVLALEIERRDLMVAPTMWRYTPRVEIPPSAPRCTKYAARPASIETWWYTEARRLRVPGVV